MSSRPSTAAPPSVRELERLARGHRLRPVRDPLQQERLPRLGERVRAVVRRAAVDAEPHRNAGIAQPPHRRDTRGEPHVRRRAMRNAGAGLRKVNDAVAVEFHAVRVPHVAPHPAQVRRVLRRRAVEALAAVGDVGVVLGQVRVHRDAVRARQRRRLAHQVGTHRERRARRNADPQHREAPRVVERLDQPARVREDRVFALDERVGRQAAPARAHAHAAARGVEAHAHRACRLDRVVETAAVGIQVQVIRRRRAAGQEQLRHRRLRRHPDHLGREAAPQRIEPGEPAEQLRVLHRGQRASEALEHVVVRVDEPGQYDVPGEIDHYVGARGQVCRGTDGDDRVVLDVDPAAGRSPGARRPS